MSEETRATSDTGGQKGRKIEEYALIPAYPLSQLASVYGFGASKYAPYNYLKGYPWTWSISALFRHIEAWRSGNSIDEESGFPHLAHAAWHLFALMMFEKYGLGEDDRWIKS